MASLCFVLYIKDRATEHCGHIPRKKNQNWIHAFPTSYTFQLLLDDDDDDDIIDVVTRCETVSFYDFYVKLNSRYSLVHILPISFSKSALGPSIFHDLYVESNFNYNFVRILPTPSSKRAPNAWVFSDFYLKSSSRYSLARIFSTLFSQSAPTLTFCFIFKPEFTRSRPVSLPNYLMTMWLTWWCGWHDGENAAHDIRP